jgi:NADP-dependent aldehyde dehydrogenase
MIHLTGKQLINGTFTAGSSRTFTASNRLLAIPLPDIFFEATGEEIAKACEAAGQAFALYRRRSGTEKALFLEAIATQIVNLGDQLLELANMETGLPLARLQGERGRTVGQLNLFAKQLRDGHWVNAVIDTPQPERKPIPRADLRSMQIALGPAAIFGASNFPFAFSVAGGDTASALAAGCPVIFKAHPAHPGTCELMANAILQAIKETNMPAGVFSMVHGASHEVGMTLIGHPQIKAVGFTGSFRGGKALYDAAVRREEPIPVYAEMGSVNPVFFLPNIIKEKKTELARSLAASITLGVGQFCTNPGLFVLQDKEESRIFTEVVRAEIAAVQMAPMLTDTISLSYSKGVDVLARLTNTEMDGDTSKPQIFLSNTAEVLGNEELREEVFGPCSVGVMATDKTEIVEFAKSLKGQLTATIHGTKEDLEEYSELIEVLQLKAGRLVINGFPTGVEVGYAMVHGGPFPATTDSRSTSVGTNAIYRFTRPLCFQDFPESLLPPELQRHNPLGIYRTVDGILTK